MKRLSAIALSFLLACAVLSAWPSKASALVGAYNFFDFPLISGLPENLPPNLAAIQLFPIYATGDKLIGPSGNKVPGVNKFDTMTLLYQLVYFWPIQPFNPHFQLAADFFLDYAVTHADAGAPVGKGVGGGGFDDILFSPIGLFGECQTCAISDWFRPTGFVVPLINYPSGEFNQRLATAGGFPGLGLGAYALVLAFIGWHTLGPDFGKYLSGTLIQQDFLYVHQIDTRGSGPTNFTLGDIIVFDNAVMLPVFKGVKIGAEETWLRQLQPNNLAFGFSPPSKTELQELGVGPAVTLAVGPVNCFVDWNFDVYNRNTFNTFAIESTCDYAFTMGDLISELTSPTFL